MRCPRLLDPVFLEGPHLRAGPDRTSQVIESAGTRRMMRTNSGFPRRQVDEAKFLPRSKEVVR